MQSSLFLPHHSQSQECDLKTPPPHRHPPVLLNRSFFLNTSFQLLSAYLKKIPLPSVFPAPCSFQLCTQRANQSRYVLKDSMTQHKAVPLGM